MLDLGVCDRIAPLQPTQAERTAETWVHFPSQWEHLEVHVPELTYLQQPFELPALVAELAANAVLHGRVPGRCFRLGLVVTSPATLRIEVTDARGDRLPAHAPEGGGLLAESGRGLLLVAELADRWGVEEGPVPCKTVWAELDLGPVA